MIRVYATLAFFYKMIEMVCTVFWVVIAQEIAKLTGMNNATWCKLRSIWPDRRPVPGQFLWDLLYKDLPQWLRLQCSYLMKAAFNLTWLQTAASVANPLISSNPTIAQTYLFYHFRNKLTIDRAIFVVEISR